jgi:hypothetical protein
MFGDPASEMLGCVRRNSYSDVLANSISPAIAAAATAGKHRQRATRRWRQDVHPDQRPAAMGPPQSSL